MNVASVVDAIVDVVVVVGAAVVVDVAMVRKGTSGQRREGVGRGRGDSSITW